MLHINRIKIYEKFINQEELSEEVINIIRLFDEEFNSCIEKTPPNN